MDKVCCVIDFDGFQIRDKFLVREFGYIGADRNCSANSIKFDLRSCAKDLKPADWKTVRYVTNHFTGLPFKPTKGEDCIPISCLDSKVKAVHDLFKTSKRNTVAFKGGDREKSVLDRLGIPYLNLETFGCPKYDVLKEDSDLEDCGYHIEEDRHCPLAEVTAFRDWMVEKLSKE